jgi:hypothetical protein
VIVLAALCGLIAIVLMFLNRIKMLFKAFRECGFTMAAARDGFHAMVADAKTVPAATFLGVAIFCAFALLPSTFLLGLVALGTLATLLSAIGRWRVRDRRASCSTFEPSAVPWRRAVRNPLIAPRSPAEATSGLIRRASLAGNHKNFQIAIQTSGWHVMMPIAPDTSASNFG